MQCLEYSRLQQLKGLRRAVDSTGFVSRQVAGRPYRDRQAIRLTEASTQGSWRARRRPYRDSSRTPARGNQPPPGGGWSWLDPPVSKGKSGSRNQFRQLSSLLGHKRPLPGRSMIALRILASDVRVSNQ